MASSLIAILESSDFDFLEWRGGRGGHERIGLSFFISSAVF